MGLLPHCWKPSQLTSSCRCNPWTVAHQDPLSLGFSRQEYWSGLPFLSPGDFLPQGLNLGLLHCRQILYQLSHKGSPKILEWIAHPFSSRSSQPSNQTRIFCIVGGFICLAVINWGLKVGRIFLWRRKWLLTPVFLPRKSHG